MTAPEIPWAGPPLLSDEDVITILREGGAHPGITGEDEIDRAHLAKCNMVGAIRLAYAKGLGEAHHDETAYDNLIERLMANVGEDWEASEGSAESILIDYVHALEQRVAVLGGHLGAHDGGRHYALGQFIKAAEKHVTTESTYDWNNLVAAWDEYVRIGEAAK